MTTHVPGDLNMCVVVRGDFGLHWDEISLHQTPEHDLGMTQVATRPAAGGNATVLQDGVEVGGSTCTGLSGRERLHGGEDQGETVCHVLVWGTGQGRRVAVLIYSHDCCSSAQ